MKEYTTKEMKALKANPYTFKVTKYKLYFTVGFKQAFRTAYQAGMTPGKIPEDFGYDLILISDKIANPRHMWYNLLDGGILHA